MVDSRQALGVPRAAVVRAGRERVVFVRGATLPDGRVPFQRIAVDIAEDEAGDWLEVKSWLSVGQEVVTSGLGELLALAPH